MPRSALKSADNGGKKSVRYASLGNDGQVILFASSDSNVPDESGNRPVDTEEQSESNERRNEQSEC